MPAFIDITGQRFGRLTALRRDPRTFPDKHVRWRCQCDCGNVTLSASINLRQGKAQSCGCAPIEASRQRFTTHGGSYARAYRSYHAARARCQDPKNERFKHYGGRGIEFRLPSFADFFKSLGERPLDHELDRIDVEGHYEMGNVRWWPRGKGAKRRSTA